MAYNFIDRFKKIKLQSKFNELFPLELYNEIHSKIKSLMIENHLAHLFLYNIKTHGLIPNNGIYFDKSDFFMICYYFMINNPTLDTECLRIEYIYNEIFYTKYLELILDDPNNKYLDDLISTIVYPKDFIYNIRIYLDYFYDSFKNYYIKKKHFTIIEKILIALFTNNLYFKKLAISYDFNNNEVIAGKYVEWNSIYDIFNQLIDREEIIENKHVIQYYNKLFIQWSIFRELWIKIVVIFTYLY